MKGGRMFSSFRFGFSVKHCALENETQNRTAFPTWSGIPSLWKRINFLTCKLS